MWYEVNMAVQPVQTMNCATKGGEKPIVKVAAPMRRDNDVRRTFSRQPMGEVVHFGVRDVPAFLRARASPPSGFGRHHLQGRPHANDALYWPLTVLAGGLEKSLDTSQAVDLSLIHI